MAQSSRYFYLDSDILLEFIYHDQGNPSKYQIEVDDNGSEVKFLDTVKGITSEKRQLINELGSAVVNFDVTETSGYLSVENFASRTSAQAQSIIGFAGSYTVSNSTLLKF